MRTLKVILPALLTFSSVIFWTIVGAAIFSGAAMLAAQTMRALSDVPFARDLCAASAGLFAFLAAVLVAIVPFHVRDTVRVARRMLVAAGER